MKARFGNRLKELRQGKKYTQEDLAKTLNVHKGTVSNWENGHRFPDEEVLVKLSDIFECTLDYLLGRTNERNPNKKGPFPEEFTSPEEAVKFLLEQNVIMGFGGFDVNTMSDEEVLEFANELLNQLRILSYKYKK